MKINMPENVFKKISRILVLFFPNNMGIVRIPDALSLSTSFISQKIVFIKTLRKINKYTNITNE